MALCSSGNPLRMTISFDKTKNPAIDGLPVTICKLAEKEDSCGLVDSCWRNCPYNSLFILQAKHSTSNEVNAKLTSTLCSQFAHLVINGIAVTTSHSSPPIAAEYTYQARQ